MLCAMLFQFSRWLLFPALLLFVADTQAQTNDPAVVTNAKENYFATPNLEYPAAVSEINGKLDYSGGNMNSAEGHNFSGSITLPVAKQFGFQADALYSRISGADFFGGAGHFFWRNPDLGLLGLTGGYLHRDGVETFQFGAEAEAYWKRFTFGFFGGAGSIKYSQTVPFIDTNPTRFVGRLSASYYPVDNLRVGVSFTTAFRDNLAKGEIEYQTPINGLALTGEVAKGNNGYDHLLFGVRYYFGGNKTLRNRQRQDDPPGLMPQILHSLGVYGAEYNRKGNAYVAAHPISNPGSGNSGGGNYGYYGISAGGNYGVILTSLTVIPPPPIPQTFP